VGDLGEARDGGSVEFVAADDELSHRVLEALIL
jgi:hypothetical protein